MIPLIFFSHSDDGFRTMWRNCDSIFCGLLYFTGTEVEGGT
jgi:hypothetical protein